MPWSEWRKALMPLLGGCIGALLVGVIWDGWHEMEWILGGFLIATAINVLVRWALHRWTVVTPDEITASLNAAGVTEWYSVGVEDRQGTVTALVGVTALTDDVRRRVREALSPIPVELHQGDRPQRY